MDSNSSSYLVLLATVVLFLIVFFFLSGMKRKPSTNDDASENILPFEIRTSHLFQLVSYLWVPITLSVPILIFKEIHIHTYFIFILVMMVVLLSWFIAAQHALESEDDEKN